MEHLTLEVKFATGDAGLVSGYASLFGRPADYVNDVIEAGAFRSTLAAHNDAGTMPDMLREHKGKAVGDWLEIEEDELGLRVKGRLDLTTPEGRDAYEAVRTGKIDGLSIGYRAEKADRDPNGTRTIHEIELHEISLVRRPAASRARVLSVKSAPAGTTAAKGAAILKRKTMEKKATAPGGDPGNEETATIDDRVAGLEEKVGRIDTRLSAVEEKVGSVKSVADRIEAKLNRPGATVETKAAPEKLEAKAFNSFVRQGIEKMGADEVKTLRAAEGSAGGYLAPAEFVKELDKNLVLYSPVRQAARVSNTSSGSVILPKRTGTLTGGWVGEIEERPESEPSYGEQELVVHEIAVSVPVSNQLLEDSAFNLDNELASDFAEEFGRIEAVAFVAGNGVKKPLGILNTPGIPTINSGNASTLGSADALIDLYHSLPSFYAANAAWGMNRTTMGAVRKMKDGNGAYLWQEAISEGNPPTILGRPVVEMPDLPDVGANALAVVFGNFRFFRIFDRVNLSVLRDPYSQAKFGKTVFHARRRLAAGVTKPEAFRLLKIAA